MNICKLFFVMIVLIIGINSAAEAKGGGFGGGSRSFGRSTAPRFTPKTVTVPKTTPKSFPQVTEHSVTIPKVTSPSATRVVERTVTVHESSSSPLMNYLIWSSIFHNNNSYNRVSTSNPSTNSFMATAPLKDEMPPRPQEQTSSNNKLVIYGLIGIVVLGAGIGVLSANW